MLCETIPLQDEGLVDAKYLNTNTIHGLPPMGTYGNIQGKEYNIGTQTVPRLSSKPNDDNNPALAYDRPLPPLPKDQKAAILLESSIQGNGVPNGVYNVKTLGHNKKSSPTAAEKNYKTLGHIQNGDLPHAVQC